LSVRVTQDRITMTLFLCRPGRVRSAAALLGLGLGLLTGCSSLSQVGASASTLGGLVRPYKMDILQGNVVVREQVQALQTGMPREQVQAILGTPLIASLFHADRWDYVFTFQRQGQEPQQRRVTVFFANDALARIEADALPSEQEFVSSLDVRRGQAETPALQATPEQLEAFHQKNRPAAGATATPTSPVTPSPATSYPPLEPR